MVTAVTIDSIVEYEMRSPHPVVAYSTQARNVGLL